MFELAEITGYEKPSEASEVSDLSEGLVFSYMLNAL